MSTYDAKLRILTTKMPTEVRCGEALLHTEDRFQSTRSDRQEMQRVGHRQELVRHYRVFSMIAFVAVAISSWQLTIFQITPGLLNGGMPVLMYSNIWSFIGFGPIIFSMAEMASMAPVAGAHYHWVSEFAPESCQRILSYVTGCVMGLRNASTLILASNAYHSWTSTLAWQSGNAGSLLLVGTLMQTVIRLNCPTYGSPNWHGALLAVAVVVMSCTANICAAKCLPYWQNTAFVAGFFVYSAFVVPVWVAGPRASTSQVWTNFEVQEGAWPDLALAILIGQQPALIGQVGIDTVGVPGWSTIVIAG